MIAACPKCQTRYRLKPEQLGTRGIRLRCRRCEALFRVLPPPSSNASATPAPDREAASAAAPATPPAPSPVASRPPQTPEVPEVPEVPEAPSSPAPSPPQPAAAGPEPLASQPQAPARMPSQRPPVVGAPTIIVALGDGAEAKHLADRLGAERETSAAVADGPEVLLALHRTPPKAAILDASLRGLSGHAVCEVIKRSPLLRDVRVLILQSPESPTQDAAAEGFGADLYLDRTRGEEECTVAVERALEHWELVAPRARESIAAAPPPDPSTASGEPGPAAAPEANAEQAEEVERAERLARIAVSDIVLYNEEKFSAAIRSDDPLAAMRDEVEEGRALLRGRIAAAVFSQRDFVGDELLRLVRERA